MTGFVVVCVVSAVVYFVAENWRDLISDFRKKR